MTLLRLILVACVCRRPLIGVGARLLAFAVGFPLGWEAISRYGKAHGMLSRCPTLPLPLPSRLSPRSTRLWGKQAVLATSR